MKNTLSRLFLHTVRSFPRNDFMSYKSGGLYQTISTEEFGRTVRWLSLGLQDLGVEPGDKMILLAENGPWWIMADLANLCLGGITVPVYTTLASKQIEYIITNSDATTVICSGQELWAKLKPLRSRLQNVRHFISLEPDEEENAIPLSALLQKGECLERDHPELFERNALEIQPEDLASIIYTSGTTGVPKGVMLTHDNFMSNASVVSGLLGLSEKDTAFSFLPLSHVFERTVNYAFLYRGCRIGYAESIETVAEDILQIKPHFFACVPRMLEKIYIRVTDKLLEESRLKRKIFSWAIKTGKNFSRKQLEKELISFFLSKKRALAEKLVFSKITDKLGGNVRFCVSAAAPLARDIAEFFHAVGLTVLEGYGLTETSPGVTVNTLETMRLGTVGQKIPGVEVRLANDGEILVRGPNVMKGYYKDPAATAEVLRDGWLHTGDIGTLDQEGYLTITDRKKDIIITSGGKNTAPQPTETRLRMSRYITNAVVIGDRRKFLSALIVPDFIKIMDYARANNISFQGLKDLVKNSHIVQFIESEVEKYTKDLSRFENIKKIALLDRDFDLENGEITPTLKVRRNIITQKYHVLIESLYAE
ncbi:MAG: long-chain fatty acid--CoA ligase [Candidatus Aminicenantes bacterium]|nr:long-chain fatty acid--CoA ligase [Candidatus Aminicenantes bacterium]